MGSIRLSLLDAEDEISFLLSGNDAVIGRDEQADIVVDRAMISRRHGCFKAGPLGYTYEDLSSSNGSALISAGTDAAEAVLPGKSVPLQEGDVLMLGGVDDHIRLRVSAVAVPQTKNNVGSGTVISRAPLMAIAHRGQADLADLASRVMSSVEPSELAEAALQYLETLGLNQVQLGVLVCGRGFSERAGNEIPEALAQVGRAESDVVLVDGVSTPLPTSASVVRAEVEAAIVAPVMAHETWHGTIAIWSSLGSPALAGVDLSLVGVVGTLVGLAASNMASRRALETTRRRLERENAALREGLKPEAEAVPIGRSQAFIHALELCRNIATSDVPVLLHGETGTGKEVLAKYLHASSPRAARAFVAFNCAAVPESLVESELFGHVRGSFTGATGDRAGLFEEADGGTIFLDEIGEMPAVMQAKLLRVLQDGEIRRVGASKTRKVDVRVVSATHKDLPQRVEEGLFRADLMYRLNAVTIEIPPLRERGDDLLRLAHFFLERATARSGKTIPGYARSAVDALARYTFPGNVRELENEVARAVALTSDGLAVRAEAFSPRVAGANGLPATSVMDDNATLKEWVEQAERSAVRQAMDKAEGNVSQAARALGLSRPGLYKLMERLQLRTKGSQESA